MCLSTLKCIDVFFIFYSAVVFFVLFFFQMSGVIVAVMYYFYHLKTLRVSLAKDWGESAMSSLSRSTCTASVADTKM